MSTARVYRSPLRAEQVEQTRERILERVAEIIADERAGEITVGDAARRAGVSVRTAYRYFPTKEAMLDALNAWFQSRLTEPLTPKRIEDIPSLGASLYMVFESQSALIRASRRTRTGAEARARRKANQVRMAAALFERSVPRERRDEARRAASAVHSLMAADTWMNMRDNWHLSPVEASESVEWALGVIVAALRAHPRPSAREPRSASEKRATRPRPRSG